MSMRALVVGYGSIGSRHATVLSDLGVSVSVVTAQTIKSYSHYKTLEKALKETVFDCIVIANPTHLHHASLEKISSLNFQGTVLVEKPLFSKFEMQQSDDNKNIYVAYNLRFHALLHHLKKLIADDELVSFSVNVGSYLPHWRKNTDYRDCYSAKKECGGGVLRDLSHELDYVTWLCGKCIEVTAMGGRLGTLEISSDDIYSILMRCENCPMVNVQLDYLNRMPTRKIIIHTKKQNTIFLDLIQGDLIMNGEIQLQVKEAIANTFKKQHESILKKEFQHFCTYRQGLAIMRLIESIELAAVEKKWVTL